MAHSKAAVAKVSFQVSGSTWCKALATLCPVKACSWIRQLEGPVAEQGAFTGTEVVRRTGVGMTTGTTTTGEITVGASTTEIGVETDPVEANLIDPGLTQGTGASPVPNKRENKVLASTKKNPTKEDEKLT